MAGDAAHGAVVGEDGDGLAVGDAVLGGVGGVEEHPGFVAPVARPCVAQERVHVAGLATGDQQQPRVGLGGEEGVELVDQVGWRHAPTAVGQRGLDPAERRRLVDHQALGAQLLEGPAGAGGDAGEELVLGHGGGVDVVGQHVDVEPGPQVVEDLPGVAVVGPGRHHRRGVPGADLGQELVEEERHVGPLEGVGAAEGVRGPVDRLGVDHVEHGQHVERVEGGGQALGVGERAGGVAAVDDQAPHLTPFDLVDERRTRVLAHPRGQIGPARWGRRALEPLRGGPHRAAVVAADEAGVEPHAAGTVVRTLEDVERPGEPLRDVGGGAHGDAGAGLGGDALVAAQGGDQVVDLVAGEAGALDGHVPIDRIDGGPQPVEARGPLVEVGAIGPVGEQLADEVGHEHPVRSGAGLEVPGRQPRRLRVAGVDHPDLAVAVGQLAQPGHRVGEGVEVAVADHRVDPDEDRQGGPLAIDGGQQVGAAGHELGHERLARRVQGDGGVAVPGRQALAEAGRVPGAERIERRCRGHVHADGVGAVLVTDAAQPGGEVVEAGVPPHRREHAAAVALEGAVDAVRVVVQGAHRPALRAGVAVRHRVVVVAPGGHHAVAVGRDHERARRAADAAERAVLGHRDAGPGSGRSDHSSQPPSDVRRRWSHCGRRPP